MNLVLVDEGSDLADLQYFDQLESHFSPGSVGVARFYIDGINGNTASEVGRELYNRGVTLAGPVTYAHGILEVPLEKPSGIGALPLLGIVGIVVGAIVVGGVIFLGWQIHTASAQTGIPSWVWWLGGGALLLWIFREPIKSTAKTGAKVGTAALLRKA